MPWPNRGPIRVLAAFFYPFKAVDLQGKSNGEGRNRTGDTTIFSRVLYQLSYLAWQLARTGRAWEG